MLQLSKNIFIAIFSFLAVQQLMGQGLMENRKPNFDFFSTKNKVNSSEYTNLVAKEYLSHPDFGVHPYNSPCNNCVELIDRRTETSRYYVENGTNGKGFYLQQGHTPINYIDSAGYWRVIDYRLKQTSTPHLYISKSTDFYFSINADSGFVILNSLNNTIKYNYHLEKIVIVSGIEHSFGYANWSNYSVGDDGIRVIDAWDGIDIEIRILDRKIKTDFIIKKPSDIVGDKLIIRDHIALPTGLKFSNALKYTSIAEPLVIIDTNNIDILNIGTAYAWDSAEDISTEIFNYSLKENNALDIEIPLNWLNDPNRVYPVTIDPLVSALNVLQQPSITGSGYNAACNFQSVGCLYNLSVAVPPNCTVTDILFDFDYITAGACLMNVGGMDFKLGSCRSPSTNSYWRCPLASPGTCFGDNISAYLDFQSCIPAPQCASYNMNFQLNFFRCSAPDGNNCSANCIAAASPWTMTVVGRTVEITSVLGNNSNSPVICQGQPVNLTAQGQYGVPPYTYNWAPGNLNGPSVNVNPNNTTTYTLTITDACGQSTSQNILVAVVNTINPGFTVSPQTICPGQSVTVIGGGNGINTSYDWQMTGANPAIVNDTKIFTTNYANSGVYNITLNYSENGCTIPLTQQVNVAPITVPSATIQVTPTMPVCSNTPLTFSANVLNGGVNPFYNWTINGQTVSNSPSFTTSVYSNNDVVQLLLTSYEICVQPSTISSNTIIIQTTQTVIPTVLITASPSNQICSGTPVTFSAATTNAGTNPNYQWKVNGINVGSNSSTYTSSLLSNNDIITVTLTSNDPCANPQVITSNSITMAASPSQSPSVSISASPSNSICVGASTTFTAIPVNAGANPIYQWAINGISVGINSPTFSSTTLNNGDIVSVLITSNNVCANPNSASSNSIVMSVNSTQSPSVTISPSPSNTICSGTNVLFTANPLNSGANPSYQWYLNGLAVGNNATTYSNSSLSNGDIVTVSITANDLCISPATAISQPIVMTVNLSLIPSVTITQLPIGAICSGTSITFNASSVNSGLNPTFQWFVNGLPVGTNSTIYNNSNFQNGDIVEVSMVSSELCAQPQSATSNSINLSITANVSPSVDIISDIAMPFCDNTSVGFSLDTIGGGTAPLFQWFVNGVLQVGITGTTFNYTPGNGDTLNVSMSSNLQCVSSNQADAIYYIETLPYLTPTITISSTPSTTICLGQEVTYNASFSNAGNNPLIQWFINGTLVSNNSNTFTTASISPGDVVEASITSSYSCPAQQVALSNAVTLTVNPSISVVISPNSDTLCQGVKTQLTAIASGGNGGPYMYTWNDGTIGDMINISTTITTTYTVSVFDSCSNIPGSASATIYIYPTPIADFTFSPSSDISVLDDVFFTNESQFATWWTWDFGDGSSQIDTMDNPIHQFDTTGEFYVSLYVVNDFGCSDTVTSSIAVSEGATYYIPNSFTPDENGLNDVFKLYSTNINSYSLFIYSRSGEEVFNSEKDILNNSEIVWEGRKHNIGDILPNDVYVYYLIIRSPYIEPGNRYKRGIVTLIR
jgi:hypothetical protein